MLLTVASFAVQLGSDARHLVGEPGRQRLNRFLLRLLPQPFVAREDRVDGREQRLLERRRSVSSLRIHAWSSLRVWG